LEASLRESLESKVISLQSDLSDTKQAATEAEIKIQGLKLSMREFCDIEEHLLHKVHTATEARLEFEDDFQVMKREMSTAQEDEVGLLDAFERLKIDIASFQSDFEMKMSLAEGILIPNGTERAGDVGDVEGVSVHGVVESGDPSREDSDDSGYAIVDPLAYIAMESRPHTPFTLKTL